MKFPRNRHLILPFDHDVPSPRAKHFSKPGAMANAGKLWLRFPLRATELPFVLNPKVTRRTRALKYEE